MSTRQMSERSADYQAVKRHREARSGDLVFSGVATTGFPGWWPRVLSA